MLTLDCLRICGPALFIVDLGLKYAYGHASRFINVEMHSLYYGFLYARPVFIVVYHLYRFCLGWQTFGISCAKGFRAKAKKG